MWHGNILIQRLLAGVAGAPVPLSGPLLLTIDLWWNFLRVVFLKESDGDCGSDNRPIQGDAEMKLCRVGSGVRGKGKIGCMDSGIPPACTLELSLSSVTAGIRIPAREGAIRIWDVRRRGGGGRF